MRRDPVTLTDRVVLLDRDCSIAPRDVRGCGSLFVCERLDAGVHHRSLGRPDAIVTTGS
jgi:hypothetical protein